MVLMEGPSLRDVILVVEDTALNGSYMEEEITGNYLLPCLEYLSTGRSEEDWGDVLNCSSYHMISFGAADRKPRSSTRLQGPFISYKRLLESMERLSWSGGEGETHSSGVEAIGAALRVFDRLDDKRGGRRTSGKYMIYAANSPYYDLPIRVNLPGYHGKRMEELLPLFPEKGIHLTLLSPRKLPTLVRMFKCAGGDLSLYKEKNYAKDQRHLVLLSGIQLQETPLVVISAPQQQQTQQQQQAQQPQQTQQQQQPVAPMQMAQSFPGQQQQPPQQQPQQVMNPRPPVPAQMHMQPQQIRLQQQQNQRMQQQRLLSSGGTVVAPPPQVSQANNVQARPWQQQQVQAPQQAPQQQQGNTSNILRDRLKPQQLQQQVQDNPTLKTLLNHPPQPVGTNAQQPPNAVAPGGNAQPLIMNPQQAMPGNNNPSQPRMPGNLSTLQQQLSRPPNVVNIGGGGGGAPPSLPNNPSVAGGAINPAPQNRPREKIWEGELTWRDSIKMESPLGGGQDYKSHSVVCSVTTAVNEEGSPDVKSNAWPKKLIMQVIPKALVQNIGGHYFRNARSVFFHPEPCESLTALTRSLGSGYAGCVHFTGSPNCDIKVLILLYSSEKGAYLGFIPNDQYRFVERVRKIIQQERTEQQIMANRGGPSAAGGPVPVSMAQGRPGVPVSQQQQQQQQQVVVGGGGGMPIQNQQQSNMQMAPTTMSVSGANMNIQSGGTGVMSGATHMGQVLPQQSGAMGSAEIIQSLEQELQRQKNFYRQQQQQQQQQIQGVVRPDGSQLMQQQQQQQRMPGQNNIRQILTQPHFQQRAAPMQQQQQQQHLFMQPVMTGAAVNNPQQQQAQQQNQQQNDPMLRELLG